MTSRNWYFHLWFISYTMREEKQLPTFIIIGSEGNSEVGIRNKQWLWENGTSNNGNNIGIRKEGRGCLCKKYIRDEILDK